MALASVQKGLHNVSNNLNELMHAYIKHTASVLSGEDGALEGLQLSESAQHMIDEADLATKSVANLTKSLAAAPAANAADADAGKSKKRKREKKIKDPNAPKRPLTAAFLFAQSARPIIKKDLENELPPGAKLEPNALNLEVNKRWNEMTDEDKEVSRACPSSTVQKRLCRWRGTIIFVHSTSMTRAIGSAPTTHRTLTPPRHGKPPTASPWKPTQRR